MNKVPLVVDRDKDLKYENHHWTVKIIRAPAILVLNILPKRLAQAIFLAFSNQHSDTRIVYSSVASYKALETLYTFPERRAKKETSALDFFWQNFLSNTRSIRNRFKLVRRELITAAKESGKRKETVNILSLGGGSARAVIEAISMLNHDVPIRLKLIDTSAAAIEYSQILARSYCLNQNQIEWHRGFAQRMQKHCRNFQPDIVEMVGLLDYFPRDQAVDLITKIYAILAPNGWLITCNIHPNLESPFVAKGVNWPKMFYRTPTELTKIIIEGGFSDQNVKVVYEPFKIHGLAIARKVV